MNIGLLDADNYRKRASFPNLVLMKISAWHKAHGDNVEMWFPLAYYDRVYVSKIFGDEYTQMTDTPIMADEIIYGGTGFAIDIEDGRGYHRRTYTRVTETRHGGGAKQMNNTAENANELLRLVRENPDLPIVPMVDGECVADDSGYFTATFGRVPVDEYFVCERNEHIVFKSDNDVFDVLDEFLPYEEFLALPETEEECRQYYDALPWTKAIIVYICSLMG